MTEPAYPDDLSPDDDGDGHPGAFEAGTIAPTQGDSDGAFDSDESDDGFDDEDEFDTEDEVDEYAEEGDDDIDEATKIRLAAAMAEIDAKFGRPPAEQVQAFSEAHQQLQATLNRIDMP